MCGINGFISQKKIQKDLLASKVNGMNDLIIHRGPDDDGIFVESKKDMSIAMGMRRLSIIDLSTGNQPMFSADGNIVLVFNGEIYNYKFLRTALQNQGIQFDTNSDTEVILKLYEKEGLEGFGKLDGMFAFSIYDKRIGKVFIARDFFGEKPLYYTKNGTEFIWGSELKSILNHLAYVPPIDKMGLNLFFRLTYIPAPFTIYDNVHKLEPYSYIAYDLKSNEHKISSIDSGLDKNTPNETNFEVAKGRVKEIVQESVASRSISDVPLGTFLSGGVDSSIVSLCLAEYKSTPIETFSIGFKKKSYDETDKSQLVAKLINSNHHEFVIDEKDIEVDLHQILNNFDEPFADSSALPTYLVSKKTKEHVTVALTGDGGDEVFGGYNKYYMGMLNKKYTRIVPNTIHKLIQKSAAPLLRTSNDSRGKRFRMKRLLNSFDYQGDFYWDIISLGYTSNELRDYLLTENQLTDLFSYYKNKTGIAAPESLTDFRTIDRYVSLEGDMLVKVDRTSMLNSLECRAPLLNQNIWNYVNTLPEEFLLKGWDKKHILKEAFKNSFPEGFLDKSKSGFGAPVGDWLRTSLKAELESYIDKNILEKQKLFNPDTVITMVKNHLSGKIDQTFKVWTFYCFQKWYHKTYNNKR